MIQSNCLKSLIINISNARRQMLNNNGAENVFLQEDINNNMIQALLVTSQHQQYEIQQLQKNIHEILRVAL